jgi:hypothetical protein
LCNIIANEKSFSSLNNRKLYKRMKMEYSFFEFYELMQHSKLNEVQRPEGHASQYAHNAPTHPNVATDTHQGRSTSVMPVDQKSIEAAKLLRAKKNAEFAAKHPWIAKATDALQKEKRADQAGEKALGMGSRVRRGARVVATEPGKNPVAMGPRQRPETPDFEDQLAKAGGEAKTYPMIKDMRDHLFAIQSMVSKKIGDDDAAWKHPEVVKKARELFKATSQYLRSGTIIGPQAEEVKALHDALITLFEHLQSPGA